MAKLKKNHSSFEHENWSEALFEKYLPKLPFEHVPLSLVIPVYNCSEQIGKTLESLKRQRYPTLEVIVVDAGSTDRTLEIINSYHPLISRIYTVTDFQPVEMINRGLALTSGQYATILFPGTVYTSDVALFSLEETVLDSRYPDLAYCGSIQREGTRSPRLLNAPIEILSLEKGMSPSTLPGCWFHLGLFEKTGKFNPNFSLRADYDFFCRLALDASIRTVHLDRVYVDFDAGAFSYHKLITYAADTFRILRLHFGFWRAFTWFLGLNHLTIFRSWLRNLKQKTPTT